MTIFKRKKKPEYEPSMHFAMLVIKNDHMEVDESYDLSHFTFDELNDIMEFIEFKDTLHSIEDPADFEQAQQEWRIALGKEDEDDEE